MRSPSIFRNFEDNRDNKHFFLINTKHDSTILSICLSAIIYTLAFLAIINYTYYHLAIINYNY